MRRKLIGLLAISLAINVVPFSAIAAIKAGALCTKLGQSSILSGKKYTCVKSGKKLVWDKGVTSPSLLPKSTQTVISTPTEPTVIFPAHNVGTGLCDKQKSVNTLDLRADSQYVKVTKQYLTLWEKYNISKPTVFRDVNQRAITTFASYVVRKRESKSEIHVFLQPGLTNDTTMQARYRQLIAVKNLFQSGFDHPSFEKPITLLAFNDWAWLKDEYISLGCSTEEAQSVGAQPVPYSVVAGWAESDRLLVIFNYYNCNTCTGEGNLGILGGHELFHIVQSQFVNALTRSRQQELKQPGWFVEGGATLVGQLTSDYLKIQAYDSKYAAIGISQSVEFRNLKLENTDGTHLIYEMGLLGCEFLVSLVGFEKFVNIWGEMGKGKVFSDAFQDSTGIELKDFYLMFQEIRPVLGIGPK